MYKKLITLLIVGIGMITTAIAQDPQFSQYYAAPIYLNPGFTGSTEQQRVTINHRVQWPNLPNAFSTYSASYEFYDTKLNSGFGFLATTDAMGSAGWRTTFVGLTYSFKAQLGKKWVFSPGLNFSYGVNGVDRSKLIMRDGLIHGDGVSYDPELNSLNNSSFIDISSGAVLYNKDMWFGIAAHHMNRPNNSLIGDESRLPMKLTAHGGIKLLLYNGPKKFTDVHYLTPSVIYRTQGGTFHQLDMGLRYHIDPVAFGLWYRGIPIFGNTGSDEDLFIAQRDALVFVANINHEGFQFGYSYDFSISSTRTSTGGAHEISLSYEFARKSKKRWKQKDMLIPCPSFMSSRQY